MIHPSQAGHWYERETGRPVYEIMGANGKMVTPDIRHARKHGLYPGVTTIIRCAAAPGLETWKQKQVLLAALTLTRKPGESDDDFCARIIADSQEEGRKARDKGTEIHAAIQGHYEGRPPSEELWPHVQGVIEHIEANFPGCNWVAEKACAHSLGYGTKSDLCSENVVIDFKGSEFTKAEAAKLKTWDEHHMQLAATRLALGYINADCAICYISRNEPGTVRIIRVDEEDLQRGLDMFRALLNFWQAKQKYWPMLWKPEEKAAA